MPSRPWWSSWKAAIFSLEAALGAFEQGIAPTRQCQKVLSVAEQRVRVLLEDDGALRTEPLSPSDAP